MPKFASRMTSQPLRVGFPIEYNIQELAPSVRRAWSRTLDRMRKQGHTILPVSLPTTKLALSAYYVLAPAEASSNLAKYDGVRYGTRSEGGDMQPGEALYSETRGEGFGQEVQRRILLGAFSLSADAMDNYFIQAQRVRRLVQKDFNDVFAANKPLSSLQPNEGQRADDLGVDILICPTAPSSPPKISKLLDPSATTPLDGYMNDVFTVPASLAGLPAISIPSTTDCYEDEDGVPAGIQVIAQYGDDDLVLQTAEYLVRSNP